jgi:phospholipase D1/2
MEMGLLNGYVILGRAELYADRADNQVIYRELRDFLSLHAHYKAANFGTSVGGLRGSRKVDIPEFPKMSIPYLKSLRGNQTNKEKHMNKADYAQASRDALQKYLVELIRAVVRLFCLSILHKVLRPSKTS